MANILTELWEKFFSTKEQSKEKILVGFKINQHLWQLWSSYCVQRKHKPNQYISDIIEQTIKKELQNEEKNMAKAKKKGGKK